MEDKILYFKQGDDLDNLDKNSFDIAVLENYPFSANPEKLEDQFNSFINKLLDIVKQIKIYPINDNNGEPLEFLLHLLQYLQSNNIDSEITPDSVLVIERSVCKV